MSVDYVALPRVGYVKRTGPDVILHLTAEVAEALAVELYASAFRSRDGLRVTDRGWAEMADALFRVTEVGDSDSATQQEG